MLIHGNVKPHICHICNRTFTQASHVKRHMAVHMERRSHVCTLCNRSFAYPSELKAHAERHKVQLKSHQCDTIVGLKVSGKVKSICTIRYRIFWFYFRKIWNGTNFIKKIYVFFKKKIFKIFFRKKMILQMRNQKDV